MGYKGSVSNRSYRPIRIQGMGLPLCLAQEVQVQAFLQAFNKIFI